MNKIKILAVVTLVATILLLSCNDSYNLYHADKVVIPPKGTLVKMMTYNIYGARATKPENAANLEELAAVINAQNPDFVSLQEIDVFTKRTGKDVHQARDLAKLTGMHWHFTKAIDRDGGQYGDAVLSKYEILETKDFNLPVTAELSGENRSVCVIKVKIDDQELYVASTHFDHLASEANRILQANEFQKIVKDSLPGDLIVGADMNALPDSKTMGIVQNYLTIGCKSSCGFTFPATKPDKTIDYIMYKPMDRFFVNNYLVVDEQKASDHRPVVSLLKIKDKN